MTRSHDGLATSERIGCSKTGCPVGNGGLCLDGFDDPATDCEAAIVIPGDDPDEEAETSELPARTDPVVQLYHGDRLTLEEARAAVGSRPMRVVSFVGELDAGKTTLLAAMFELYQTGEFAGCLFAGTRTPIGFDRRCHYSRTSSGLTTPATRRTQFSEGLHFLHLALRPDDGRPIVELLLSDRSGEHFREGRRTDHDAEALDDLPAANLVVFVVNGKLLLGGRTRNRERHQVTVTARSLFERGSIRDGTQIVFVLTKVDLLRKAGQAGLEAGRVFDALVAQVERDFGERWPITDMRLAARSEDGSAPLGEGLADLLRLMLEAAGPSDAEPGSEPERPVRPYDRFALSSTVGAAP